MNMLLASICHLAGESLAFCARAWGIAHQAERSYESHLWRERHGQQLTRQFDYYRSALYVSFVHPTSNKPSEGPISAQSSNTGAAIAEKFARIAATLNTYCEAEGNAKPEDNYPGATITS